MTPTKFRVIIAGGGPVGLTAALALSKANIEFTLLEKYPRIPSEAGSDLVLSPVSFRALSQLGLYQELSAASTPLGAIQRVDHSGNDLGKIKMFEYMRENFGEPPRVLKRQDLCKILLGKLSNPQNAFCSKEIREIRETATGVLATCSDGTYYEGDMIIGADGVHSRVRSHINEQKMGKLEKNVQDNQDFFKASYICLWMRFPTGNLSAGSTFETHGTGASTQMFVSSDHAVAGIYEKLSEPITEYRRFMEEDEKALVNRWRDLPLSTDRHVTLGAMYDRKTASGLTALQEGVHNTWSSQGRSVLVGDAAHVFSPITGAGCNNGMIDVVVLTNQLHSLLGVKQCAPDAHELGRAFGLYQTIRKEKVIVECQTASHVAATATWQNIVRRLADQYLISLSWVQKWVAKQVSAEISRAPDFKFLPADKNVSGKVPWLPSEST